MRPSRKGENMACGFWGFLPKSLFLLVGPAALIAAGTGPSRVTARTALDALPRGFVENRGQWDSAAAFGAPGFYGSTWVTKTGEVRHLFVAKKPCPEGGEELGAGKSARRCARAWAIQERFVGGAFQRAHGEEPLPGRSSYLVGGDPSRHATDLVQYGVVSLGEVWPGITVRLAATQSTVEKIFHLAPGARPEDIAIELSGSQGVGLGEGGELVVRTGEGEVRFSPPVAWQEVGGVRVPVSVAYRLDEHRARYGFVLGPHDPTKPLWIDPIVQSTYLGGSAEEVVRGIAINPTSGDVYVVGDTGSNNFPVTTGAFDTTFGSPNDAFVARINAALTTFLQVTYYGGSPGFDEGHAITLDPATGNVFIAGVTTSTTLPNTAGAAYTTPNDVFIARLDPNLTSVFRTTFFGGTNTAIPDRPVAMVVHHITNELVVLGQTSALDLPQTAGAFQSSYGGGNADYFLARFSLDLATNPRTSYLGGNGNDFNYGSLAVYPTTGELYAAGYTNSSSFPGTAGGAQPTLNGPSDAFVARVSSDLGTRHQVTYLGSVGDDLAFTVAISSIGRVYVGGLTTTGVGFPGLTGAFDPTFNGGFYDGFVAVFSPQLDTSSLIRSTFFGGSADDSVTALLVHPTNGEVYVAGDTGSANLPNTSGGAQPSPGGSGDAFVARLNAGLTANPQTTYFGGSGGESFTSLAFNPVNGDVYLAGGVASLDLPGRTGGAQANKGGGTWDGYVARLTADLQQASDMAVTPGPLPPALAPAGSYPLSFSCTNTGAVAALNATCGVSVSTGSVGSVNCTPSVPVASLPAGGTISCTATFTAPGPAGGGDITQSGTVFTFATGATNDGDAANNTSTSATVPLIDAVSESVTLPANTVGATFNVGANDQFGTGSLPNTAVFSLLGTTTCANASINATTGVATFDVPSAGSCIVAYQVCVGAACDTAELFVAVPTAPADMTANLGALPPSLSPGGTYSGLTFSCTNSGGTAATNATCTIAVSAGAVSGVSCSPTTPVASLAPGGSVSCTYTFQAPGSQGGADTPPAVITFTATGNADNDGNASNNSDSGQTPLVDALDDSVSLPANTVGATFNVAGNDQVGSGSVPPAASFTLLGATTCSGASISATGVATFNVPAAGTCIVAYRLCYISGCDTAQLTVTAQQVEAIPTLDAWGMLVFAVLLAGAGLVLVRRVVA